MDKGHELTDDIIAELEKKIAREYRKAVKDTRAKLNDYLRRFEVKDEKWRLMVAAGEKTAEEYNKWRTGQIMIGKRWNELRESLAEDYHIANVIARSIVTNAAPDIYALNHDYATFTVEKAGHVDTSYTLYNRDAAEKMLREDKVLPTKIGKRTQAELDAALAAGKDLRWQKGQIQSVTLQSILQGESIPNMAKRIAQTMGETNHKSTIRYARTAATGAQNAGRQDAYKRAEERGVKMSREWVATLDNRTRHAHRQLDGQIVGVDEPFTVDGEEIMFPGDPNAADYLIWNCRCTMVPVVNGWDDISGKTRSNEAIDDMSYEEWRQGHSQSERITKQEEISEAMKREYNREYRNAGR